MKTLLDIAQKILFTSFVRQGSINAYPVLNNVTSVQVWSKNKGVVLAWYDAYKIRSVLNEWLLQKDQLDASNNIQAVKLWAEAYQRIVTNKLINIKI